MYVSSGPPSSLHNIHSAGFLALPTAFVIMTCASGTARKCETLGKGQREREREVSFVIYLLGQATHIQETPFNL